MAKKEKAIEKVTTLEELQAKMALMRRAQTEFTTYTQEQVDAIFLAAATAANAARIPLAKLAREETGMGLMEDKVIKNHFAAEYTYNKYRNDKTCGLIEDDKTFGLKRYAEPLGLLAGIVPTTNPTSTTIYKLLVCLKTRNCIIISPHPRAKECTIATCKVMLEAAEKAGAPKGCIGWIDKPSIELSKEVMKEADGVLATGGPGMVKSAYSSGKPAIGVGSGNCAVIIDETADILLAVNSLMHSKTFDNGMICASEQSVTVLASIYDKVKEEFIRRGAYFLKEDEIDKVRKIILKNGSLNAKIVGQPPHIIGDMAGVMVPKKAKILIGEVESVDPSEPFAHEKLSTLLAMYKAKDFDDALAKAGKLVRDGGHGHSAGIYIDVKETEKLEKHAKAMEACRILVNSPSSQGGIGDIYNFKLAPSLTLGCGSWGGNSVSENVAPKHLINIKCVADRRENMLWLRLPEKVYFKKGCTPVALRELKTEYECKRAFIVTDNFLFTHGFTRNIESYLDSMHIAHACFYGITTEPSLENSNKGLEMCNAFKPDVIIAVGGGSALDTGKYIWIMYEHPEVNFKDMAMRFMDIRKRVYKFPKLGNKAKMVAISTSSGTGSEVTPYTILSDAETGLKHVIADYELLPTMAIIDADNMMTQPKRLTAGSGFDALTHAFEAYGSLEASDFTDGFALKAIKLIFENLEDAYKDGTNVYAREKMANASALGGLAFANAFLGVGHSMAHKLGSFHHLPHGICCAMVITETLKYNAVEVPTRMGTFPQYQYPHTLRRYAEIAEFIGITGKTDQEKLDKLIDKINALKKACNIEMSVKELGLDEKEFLASLDRMSEAAFDDQCTGANPRYPLIPEIKEMYKKVYYGK